MHHVFLIHSSVEGHLGCSQFQDIMNRTAINMAEQVSLWQMKCSLGICPRVVQLAIEVAQYVILAVPAFLL